MHRHRAPSDHTTHLVLAGQGTLGALSLAAQLLQGPAVTRDVLLVLLLDQLDEVLHHTLIKVLTCRAKSQIRLDTEVCIQRTCTDSWD